MFAGLNNRCFPELALLAPQVVRAECRSAVQYSPAAPAEVTVGCPHSWSPPSSPVACLLQTLVPLGHRCPAVEHPRLHLGLGFLCIHPSTGLGWDPHWLTLSPLTLPVMSLGCM